MAENIYVQRLLKWAKELENESWGQCVGRLSLPGARKCKSALGIACHLSKTGEWRGDFYVCGPKDKEEDQLPKAVMAYYGLTDPHGADIMLVGNPGIAALFPNIDVYNNFGNSLPETAYLVQNYAEKIALRK